MHENFKEKCKTLVQEIKEVVNNSINILIKIQ